MSIFCRNEDTFSLVTIVIEVFFLTFYFSQTSSHDATLEEVLVEFLFLTTVIFNGNFFPTSLSRQFTWLTINQWLTFGIFNNTISKHNTIWQEEIVWTVDSLFTSYKVTLIVKVVLFAIICHKLTLSLSTRCCVISYPCTIISKSSFSFCITSQGCWKEGTFIVNGEVQFTIAENVVRTMFLDICTVKVLSFPLFNLHRWINCLTWRFHNFFEDFWIKFLKFVEEGTTILCLEIISWWLSICHIEFINQASIIKHLTMCICTSSCYYFFTWESIQLVWNPVSNDLNTLFVKSLEGITKVFFWTVFIVFAHGKVITVCEGITIFNNRIKESAILRWDILRCNLKWRNTPWLEEVCVSCNQFVSVLTILFDKVLEVWEAFVNHLCFKCCRRAINLIPFFIGFCWWFSKNVLIFSRTYWYPNWKVTTHINSLKAFDFISCEDKISLCICIFNNLSIWIIQWWHDTFIRTKQEWTVGLVLVGCTHIYSNRFTIC